MGDSTYSDMERDDILRRWYHGTPKQQLKALEDLRRFLDTNWEHNHIRDRKPE